MRKMTLMSFDSVKNNQIKQASITDQETNKNAEGNGTGFGKLVAVHHSEKLECMIVELSTYGMLRRCSQERHSSQ